MSQLPCLIFDHIFDDFLFLYGRYEAVYQYLQRNLLFEWAKIKKNQMISGKKKFLKFSFKCIKEFNRRLCKTKRTCKMYRKLFIVTNYVILTKKLKRRTKWIKDYKERICFIQSSILRIENL